MSSVLRGLYWPFGIVVRACRGVWWVLGFGPPQEKVQLSPSSSSSPERHNVSGRKRVRGLTRLLLFILPRWLQRALGFPVYSSIGRCVSPEIRESPTKPSGKGSKRKQDELDEEDYIEEEEEAQGEEVEEEDGRQTWVEALNQELNDEDDGPEVDPDYEPSTVETESEEYRSHNNTESDLEV
ncbi:oogenesis-related [Nelusetta ayraudi]|uniref:oogenesis-related n=1 Tax=Nelusetta ayraudi TaxID=303726 RepID=UPI003F6EC47D